MKKDIDEIQVAVLNEAKRLRDEAGYSGSHNDGGASRLESELNYFLKGVKAGMIEDIYSAYTYAEVPKEWEKYFIKEDPQYKQYLELKKKFEE